VDGILTERRDFMAWWLGYANTTYADIRQSIALAEIDPAVKRIEYRVSSPGGNVDGLFDTLGTIQDAKKPQSVITSYAASAAFAISAVAGKITATNAAVQIGSIGVAASFFVSPEEVDITNRDSPNKRPDPTSEEGKAVIQDELDALFELFIDAIAKGRGTTMRDVRENFGRGSVFVAGEAKRRGMIDKVQRPMLRAVSKAALAEVTETDPEVVVKKGTAVGPSVAAVSNAALCAALQQAKQLGLQPHEHEVVTSANAPEQPAQDEPEPAAVAVPDPPQHKPAGLGGDRKGKKMDIETLKREHPEAYKAALQEGIDQERVRVMGHLQWIEDDQKSVVQSITNGEQFTTAHMSKYLKAASRRNAIAERQETSTAVADATATVAEPQGAKDELDQVADEMERQRAAKAKAASAA
jgi:ClpP class serine protease